MYKDSKVVSSCLVLMALRALGNIMSRRAAGHIRAIAAPLTATPGDHFWIGAAQELGAPAGGLVDSPLALSPWSMTTMRGKKSATKRLTDALDDELEHEQENYKQDELLEGGPPHGYQLEDIPGKTRLVLKKKYRDLEDIEIDLLVSDQPPPTFPGDDLQRDSDTDEPEARPTNPEDLESGETNYVVLFNVTVTKGSDSLVFECESDGAYLDIQKIMFEKKGGNQDMTDYLGPMYEELEEELKGSWESYLEERGINAPMGDYLLQLAHDKEQREYMSWLQKVKTFVAK